ncbi:hypothetical protein [Streptomyces flavalbus]|uniref:Integral membrane protein n=1 Tax=Streptomyces flavalbus TaxID=2665155 RepID=A0ABW2WC75_9ACTN
MYGILLGAAMTVAVVTVAMGVAGAVTGWVPPYGRGRVLRPRLYGYGTLAAGAGLGGSVSLGSYGPYDGPETTYTVVALASMACFATGLFIQVLAQRPGRARHSTPAP